MPATASPSSRVAVVIPTYNCAPYIAGAFDSVLCQTWRDFSVFVVDDGSQDNTISAVEPYLDQVIFLREEQSGAAAARNRGIRASSSEYVAFLDADDRWASPTKLAQQIELLNRHREIGLVCSDFSISGGAAPTGSYFSRIGLPSSGHVFARLVRSCPICTSTVVVRRQCLVEVGLFHEPLSVAEDLDLWLRIASRWDVAFIPEVLVAKQVRAGNLSSSTTAEGKLRNGIAAIQHVMSSCPQISRHEKSQIEWVLAGRHYDYGSYLLETGDTQAARRAFLAALRSKPGHWRSLTKLGGSFLSANSFRFLVRLVRGRRKTGKREVR